MRAIVLHRPPRRRRRTSDPAALRASLPDALADTDPFGLDSQAPPPRPGDWRLVILSFFVPMMSVLALGALAVTFGSHADVVASVSARAIGGLVLPSAAGSVAIAAGRAKLGWVTIATLEAIVLTVIAAALFGG